MTDQKKKQNPNIAKLIGLAVVMMISQPVLFVPLAIFIGIVWLAIKGVGKIQQGPSKPKQEKFDDCPQPIFCFHKDKGEHHVRRGKEIDPWDRPDIDISKYQRNR